MKTTMLIVAVAVLAVAGWLILKGGNNVVLNTPSPTPTSSPSGRTVTITYTDSGYSPSTVTVGKGDMVTWQNKSSSPMWTASAVHPTHTVYPNTSITLCDSDKPLKIFDACAGVAPGQSWSFTFNYIGSWRYHDHLNSAHTGIVVVQ